MPVCRVCGNYQSFSCSDIPSEVPYANPPLPLQGFFTLNGQLSSVEYTGLDQQALEQAWDRPDSYFDTCSRCGSHELNW